jgi:hypothetical protein
MSNNKRAQSGSRFGQTAAEKAEVFSPKLKHERPKGKTFEETAIFVLGLLASVMLGISLFTLSTVSASRNLRRVLLSGFAWQASSP